MKRWLIISILAVISWSAYSDCLKDSIITPTPFMGNSDEIFKLLSGSVWQVKYEYEYLYAYYPNVVICPSENKLIIHGMVLNVVSVSSNVRSSESAVSGSIIESRIDGDFNGWGGETIYKLQNGQVWQQSSYYYYYHYSYSPKAIIYKSNGQYFMQVEGVDKDVQVTRVN